MMLYLFCVFVAVWISGKDISLGGKVFALVLLGRSQKI